MSNKKVFNYPKGTKTELGRIARFMERKASALVTASAQVYGTREAAFQHDVVIAQKSVSVASRIIAALQGRYPFFISGDEAQLVINAAAAYGSETGKRPNRRLLDALQAFRDEFP